MTSTEKSKTLKTQSHKTYYVLPEGNRKAQAHHQCLSHLQQLQLYQENHARKSTAPTLYKKAKDSYYILPIWSGKKILAIVLNLILWAEHANMGPEKFFKTTKYTGICHYLSCCPVPVVLEEDEIKIPEAKLGSKGKNSNLFPAPSP